MVIQSLDANIDTKSKAIFCDQLNENLISVGKMCENNNVIVFDQHEYVIFEGEVSIQGRVVHSQNRDPLTGLYALTLTTDIRPEIRTREHVLFTDVNELRNICSVFQVWAEKTNKNKVNNFTDEEQQL